MTDASRLLTWRPLQRAAALYWPLAGKTTLDGIDVNEISAGGSETAPTKTNPDSLAEFRVITSNFTADRGRNSGAQVAMVTRSGSNEFHGSLFEFYRTPSLNANEWENNLNRVGKRQFVQHVAGGSVGGPVFKNRTFFFFNFQGLRALQTGIVTRTVYTEQARQGVLRYVRAAWGGRIDSGHKQTKFGEPLILEREPLHPGFLAWALFGIGGSSWTDQTPRIAMLIRHTPRSPFGLR